MEIYNQNQTYQAAGGARSRKILRGVLISVGALIVGLLFYLFYSYGFIKITVQGNVSNNTNISMLRQGSSSEQTTIDSSETTVKKLVRRGSYEVSAQQETINGFTIQKTGGFLTTTDVTIELSPEKNRAFVGDNPSPCILYEKSILFSYACQSSTTTLAQHVPATKNTPTYTKPVGELNLGNIDGSVTLRDGQEIVVVAGTRGADILEIPYSAFRINQEGELVNGVALNGLSENERYTYSKYRDGFVAVGSHGNVVYFDGEFSAKKLSIDSASNSDLFVASIRGQNDSVVAVYNNLPPEEVSDEAETGATKSEVIVYKNEQNTHYSFKEGYFSGLMCGENKLCLWNNDLSIYDLSGVAPRKLFVVENIDSVFLIDNELFALRENGLLAIDIAKQGGSYVFTNPGYTYCGNKETKDGFVLCVIDTRQRKSALFISKREDIIEPIDKQVFRLLETLEIENLSIYRNHLFITPRLGPRVYDPETNQYEYNSTVKQIAQEKIEGAISSSGINQKLYTVSIPLLAQ